MLNPRMMEQSAREHFLAQLRDKVSYLAEKCWPENLEMRLKELNDIIRAGRDLRVTEVDPLSDEEVAEIADDLRPLRTLKMEIEARDHLVFCLVHHGLPAEILRGLSDLIK